MEFFRPGIHTFSYLFRISRYTNIFLFIGLMVNLHKAVAQFPSNKTFDWSVLAELPLPRGKSIQPGLAGPVVGISKDYLFISGGANFPSGMPWEGGKKMYHDDTYLFKIKGNKTKWITDDINKLNKPLAYSACISSKQGIIAIGGENDLGLSDEVHLFRYDPTHHILVKSELPSLPVTTTNGCAAYVNDIVYFAGGETTNSASNQFLSLNLKQPGIGWIHLPALPVAVSHALLIYQKNGTDPCLYLIGGRQKLSSGISDLFHSVYAYSLTTQRWIKKQSLPVPVSAATGIPYGKSGIIVFGGDTGETFHQVELAMAAIHAENDPVEKQKLTDQKNKLLASHPGFSKAILSYDVASDQWSSAGIIPFDSPVTTTACIWKSTIILPCGEIRAGIRTPNIFSLNIKKK